MNEEYEIIVDAVAGDCGKNYEENLEKFREKVKEEGGFIDAIIPIRAIVIYKMPKKILGDKEND